MKGEIVKEKRKGDIEWGLRKAEWKSQLSSYFLKSYTGIYVLPHNGDAEIYERRDWVGESERKDFVSKNEWRDWAEEN